MILTAIFAIVTGLAIPVFSRLELGPLSSAGLGVVTGVFVIAALIVRARVADALNSGAWKQKRVPLPDSFPENDGGFAERSATPDRGDM
jgi:hypothetical protein